MNNFGNRATNADLKSIGLDRVANAYWNLTPSELVEESIILGQGTLTSTGALAIDTGEFTGRSPQDRFIVLDDITRNTVWSFAIITKQCRCLQLSLSHGRDSISKCISK